MLRAKSTVAIVAALSFPLTSHAAAPALHEGSAIAQDAAAIEEPVDAEIAGWRRELLRTGFEAARRYPRVPHFKNQARVIERLVEAALRMDQPQLALSMIPAIPNWRRGTGYASYAEYCAEHGLVDTAEKYTGIALEIAKRARQREATILRMRFGLDDSEPKTLKEIGEALGLTRGPLRVDLIASTRHNEAVLEVEAVPPLHRDSVVARVARAAGLPYPELVARVIESSPRAVLRTSTPTLRTGAAPTRAPALHA